MCIRDSPSWERREGWYEFADLFLWQYNHDVDRIVFLSRLPIVALHIALALTGPRFARRLWNRVSIGPRSIAAVVVVVLVGVAVWIHPHYLSYFNPIAGGPANGYRVLIDSNVDWGQDLLRLRRWMAEEGVDSVRLGWFGTADPTSYLSLIHI